MLEFNRAEWENFQSFEGAHEFEYAKSGMHLISGVNLDLEGDESYRGRHSVGSGKSSFTMVPQFALFGEIAKGWGNTKKDSIVNKGALRSGKGLRVALDFSVNGDRYMVERFRRHREGRSVLRLWERAGGDWRDVTRSDMASTQRAIDELVPWNEDTFMKVVLLSREDLRQFLDYGPPDRWRIFESIIKLDKLKDYRETLRRAKKAANDELAEVKAELSSLNTLANRAEAQANEEEAEAEERATALIAEIDGLEERLREFMTGGSMEDVLAEAQRLYSLGVELSAARRAEKDADRAFVKHSGYVSETERLAAGALDKALAADEYVKTIQPITCHACGAVQNLENYNKTLESAMEDVAYWRRKHVELVERLAVERAEAEAASLSSASAAEAVAALERRVAESPIPADYKSQILEDARSGNPNATVDELRDMSHTISLKKHELSTISDARARKLRSEAAEARKAAAKVERRKTELELTVEEVSFMDSALDVREENSIKQYAVSTVMPVFNELLRQNLDSAFDDQLMLQLDPFFNDTIVYNGAEYGYHELSTGERVKLNLCVNLTIFDAMRIHVMGSSAMFLDEIYTNIDAPSIHAFASLIRAKYSGESAVYTITHQAEAIDAIAPESVTTIVKENGASRIETSMAPTM